MPIKAVAFDAFGTVCRIDGKLNPYHLLLEPLSLDLRTLAQRVMTWPGDLRSFCRRFDHSIDPALMETIEELIDREVRSVTFFDDVIPTLTALKEAGIPTAIISNLAMPYIAPLRAHLGGHVSRFVFSCEVGRLKPDREIFEQARLALNCRPYEILMVGDKMDADVEGARAFGAKALLINRDSPVGEGISSLREVLPMLSALL